MDRLSRGEKNRHKGNVSGDVSSKSRGLEKYGPPRGAHPRKRHHPGKDKKQDKVVEPPEPLIALQDRPEGKDDEERQLESLLFGVPYAAPDGIAINIEHEGGRPAKNTGLDHISDSDLFFVDAGDPPSRPSDVADGSENENQDESEGEDTDDAASFHSLEAGPSSTPTSTFPLVSSRKAAAWHDPSDATIKVSLASDKRLRKLRDAPDDDEIDGREYERKLRQQYEKLNPAPAWASAAREKLHGHKRRRSSASSASPNSRSPTPEVENLLHSTSGLINTSQRPKHLPPNKIDITRLRNANESGKSERAVHSVRFHPSPTVPVLLTAGLDERLRLFNIDGLTNPLLQTIHLPNLPILNAQFHPSGESVLMTGQRDFFYTFDLQRGTTNRCTRGLWSASALQSDGAHLGDQTMEVCKYSDDGKVLAVAGRGGYVHLLNSGPGGPSGQVIGSLRMNGTLKDLEWCGAAGAAGTGGVVGEVSGSSSRKELMTIGDNGQVYIWDVGMRRCVRTWKDDSAYGAQLLGRGGNGKYFALGSNTGLVNVYGPEAGSRESLAATMTPIKAIKNLIHPVTSIRFDPTCQIMAIASRYKRDQIRLVHLPSLTAYSNWPRADRGPGKVMTLDFSRGSEYLAIGNDKGIVQLYSLKYFAAS
ncbi:hypothetical protein FRB99_002274 [Tulasnella sp. 403]|nr:hypothetical protein FRB99_002274 [Tulasnella sp. 403]